MQPLDLRALEIFRTVVHEGSITGAANKLCRVQSNISTRIKQLEEQLGKDLFLRHNRSLSLTTEGHTLLNYAEQLLQLSTEATEALENNKPMGTFKIGAMESTAAARLPKVLSRYHEQHPGVNIELQTNVVVNLTRLLKTGEIDVAFAAEPIEFDEFETMPVYDEALHLVVPESFPDIENVRQLSGTTMLAFTAGCAYRRYMEDWLLHNQIVPSSILVMNSYLGLLTCVSAGTGFCVVPKCVLDTLQIGASYRSYPLPAPHDNITTLLCWRKNYQSAKLEALKKVLRG